MNKLLSEIIANRDNTLIELTTFRKNKHILSQAGFNIAQIEAMELEKVEALLAAQDIFAPDKDLHVIRLTYTGSAIGEVTLSDEHDDYKWMTKAEIASEPLVDSYLKQILDEKN